MQPTRPRLRVPTDEQLVELEQQSLLAAGAQVLLARLQLITPAVQGGFDARQADALAPIRSKAVRGHLRHWWRLLAQAGTFDGLLLPGGPVAGNATRLRELEVQVWGALPRERDDDAMVAAPAPWSAVGVDVMLRGTARHEAASLARSRVPGLALALYFACEDDGRQVLSAPLNFDLRISVVAQQYPSFVEMLCRTVVCWAQLGGVGGRTSRGMGAVTLLQLTLDGADVPVHPLGDVGPAVAAAQAIEVGGVVRGMLVKPGGVVAGDAGQALAWGLQKLMGFLQLPHGRHRKTDGSQGMSRWPEARLIRHLARQFYVDPGNPHHNHNPQVAPTGLPGGTPPNSAAPRVAFGHRMMRFVGLQAGSRIDQDPPPHSIVPIGSDRLPSGVLIRPVRLAGAFGAAARHGCLIVQRHDLSGANLPTLELRSRSNVRDRRLTAWRPDWRAGADCAGIAPLELPGCGPAVFDPVLDAGQAFINLVWHDVMGGP